jgi:hypothetical protein
MIGSRLMIRQDRMISRRRATIPRGSTRLLPEDRDIRGYFETIFIRPPLRRIQYVGMMNETAGFPQIYNINSDPKERVNLAPTGAGWVLGPYMQVIRAYRESLVEHPNRPVPNVTRF